VDVTVVVPEVLWEDVALTDPVVLSVDTAVVVTDRDCVDEPLDVAVDEYDVVGEVLAVLASDELMVDEREEVCVLLGDV
jgi:hypothetical protein